LKFGENFELAAVASQNIYNARKTVGDEKIAAAGYD
jgi:hypothetical protein